MISMDHTDDNRKNQNIMDKNKPKGHWKRKGKSEYEKNRRIYQISLFYICCQVCKDK